jgi:hypothetical protein
VRDVAQGTSNPRAAAIATGSALGATAVAGLASIVVQLGGAVADVVFALLIVVAVALLVNAGYWIRRARAS